MFLYCIDMMNGPDLQPRRAKSGAANGNISFFFNHNLQKLNGLEHTTLDTNVFRPVTGERHMQSSTQPE